MKLPKFNPGKKLQATARRVRAGLAAPPKAMEDYEEEEPSMKFSSAFVVVLLLHVTAFGGIWAFGNIKAHRGEVPVASQAIQAQRPSLTSDPVKLSRTGSESPAGTQVRPIKGEGATAHQTITNPTRTAVTPARPDSGTVYTTVKGDNPVTIAHHFGVSYDELLKLNNIEDPKKLQIGQKLHIPAKKSGESN